MTLSMLQSSSTPFGSLWLVEKDIVSDTLNAGKHWDSHVYEALEAYLRADAAAIDVGANVGAHALRFAQVAQEVICFEPHPVMQFCLRQNLCDHAKARWTVRNGLYSRPVALRVRPEEGNSPSSLTWLPAGEYEVLDARPYFTKHRVSVIKVDAQGADLHCLLGLEQIILRDRPAIVFEFEEKLAELHGHAWQDYARTLGEWGYSWALVKEDHEDYLATWREK